MATRALRNHDHAFILRYKSGGVIAEISAVKFGADDDHVVTCDSNDPDTIGWSHFATTAAEQEIDVFLNGTAIIPVYVASGQTATAGRWAIGVTGAQTYKNSTALNGGTTYAELHGKFMQSGVAGDRVGLLIGCMNPYALTT